MRYLPFIFVLLLVVSCASTKQMERDLGYCKAEVKALRIENERLREDLSNVSTRWIEAESKAGQFESEKKKALEEISNLLQMYANCEMEKAQLEK